MTPLTKKQLAKIDEDAAYEAIDAAESNEQQTEPTQPAPETGEWRVEAMPIHGWRVVDATGQEIVADIYRKEDAEQIVADHNAVPRLVETVAEIAAKDCTLNGDSCIKRGLAKPCMRCRATAALTAPRRSG